MSIRVKAENNEKMKNKKSATTKIQGATVQRLICSVQGRDSTKFCDRLNCPRVPNTAAKSCVRAVGHVPRPTDFGELKSWNSPRAAFARGWSLDSRSIEANNLVSTNLDLIFEQLHKLRNSCSGRLSEGLGITGYVSED